MELELDFAHGPSGLRNLSEDELISNLKLKHYNSECYRPSFLIRLHNLTFNRAFYGVAKKSIFQPQDLTLNIRRGEIYSLGQGDISGEGEIDEINSTAIYLVGDSYSPLVSPQHCEVGGDEKGDKVWIRDLNSKNGTFVNGEKLANGIRTDLKNGDIISLGISHLHPKCKLEHGIFWVFKYKQVPLEEECNLKSLYSQVFGNNVILSNILNMTESTSQIRRVSKFWNELCLPILKKEAELRLQVNQQEERIHPTNEMGKWSQKFNRKTSVFSALGLRKVIITEECTAFDTNEIMEAGVKCFQNFFASCGPQISTIFCWFPIEPKHKNREAVLLSLFKGCSSIAHFNIVEDCSASLANVEPSKSTKILTIFPSKIKSYENLLRAFPNVVEIRLKVISMKQFFKFTCHPDNAHFVKETLKDLKVLKTAPIMFSDAALLAKFPIKIENFFLQFLTLEERPTAGISDAISGFAASLKKFTLVFARGESLEKAGLRLPKMRNLERLEIWINNRSIKSVLSWSFELQVFPNLRLINVKSERREDAECDRHNLLQNLLVEENRKYFPKLETAFVSYGQIRSKNFVTLKD